MACGGNLKWYLMRGGLSDRPVNFNSIELTRMVSWFEFHWHPNDSWGYFQQSSCFKYSIMSIIRWGFPRFSGQSLLHVKCIIGARIHQVLLTIFQDPVDIHSKINISSFLLFILPGFFFFQPSSCFSCWIDSTIVDSVSAAVSVAQLGIISIKFPSKILIIAKYWRGAHSWRFLQQSSFFRKWYLIDSMARFQAQKMAVRVRWRKQIRCRIHFNRR